LRPWLEAAIDGHDLIGADCEDAHDRGNRDGLRTKVRALGETMRRHFAQEQTCLHARARAELDPREARALAAELAASFETPMTAGRN
jgi:hypothetical protein